MELSTSRLEPVAGSGLFVVGGGYRRRDNGDLQYDGERPGPGPSTSGTVGNHRWHAHGYFSRGLRVLDGTRVVQVVVWKRRWLDVKTGGTVHSRPPDDPLLVSCSTLCVALVLFGWLDGERGVHSHHAIFPGIEQSVSARTVQRYLARCLPEALTIQQRIRRAVLERCEPRPLEQLFPSGLSPPQGLLRRRWRSPNSVCALWRGIMILLGGATELGIHASMLLAEARREVPTDSHSLLI